MSGPVFSLIIPAYNEEVLLPRLLDSVDVAKGQYHRGESAVEVIVADNASTDRTAEIATERGCRAVRVEKRRIAAARNGGAAAANGELLAFIDADSKIHRDTFNLIEQTMSSGRYVAGATGVTMERWSAGVIVTYLLFLPLVYLTKMDTGVVFCRKEDFVAAGGYNEQRYFAEDVEFLYAMRRLGKTRKQKLVRARGAKAIASTRKFEKHGDWHYFTQMPAVARMILTSPDGTTDYARKYWYEDR